MRRVAPGRGAGRVAALVAFVALVPLVPGAAGCRRGADGADRVAAVDAMAVDAMAEGGAVETSRLAPPAVAAPRCRAIGGTAIESPEDLELGDAVPFGDGYAVSLVHRTAAGRVMAIARVDRDVTSARVVDLGATIGDAPPPRLARHGDDLLVAGYAFSRASDARELAVLVVRATGETAPLAALPQQQDDSLAFDLASGLVAWDESTKTTPPRGVIRVATLFDDHGHTPRDVSPPGSDAEMPRVVADGAGYFVSWMARRPEPGAALDAEAPAAAEATGEARAYSWLEGVRVDAAGVPTGPSRRLTPASGHVSAYDVQALAGGGAPSLLVVIARDDGEAVDGSGGTLLRVGIRDGVVEAPLGLPGDGLGRGAPSLVDGPLPWLAWIGPHEGLRLLPLDAEGAPVAPPSAEPLLDEARPLRVLADVLADGAPGTLRTKDGGASTDRLLVAFPGDSSAALRLVSCTRD
jgi:hypothetical protein